MEYMAALYALRDALVTETRPAVLNRQEINPPCVFIALRGFDTWTLCAGAEASIHLYLCIGDRNDENALLALSPHLADVLEILETAGLPIEAVQADQVPGTDGSTPFPAFRIETRLSIPA